MLQSRDYHEMRAAHAHDWLRRRPEAWRQYHTRTPKDHQTWPEVPVQILASELRQHPHWVIGDFGCGEAALALSLPEWTVHSFDHVAANERVTACNMCRVPLDDEVLDVAVFCLSFWGSLDDIHSYLVEAHRTLKPSGNLRIADGRSRWEGDRRNALLDTIRAAGFNDVEVIRESCPFLYINATKGTDGRSGPIVDEVSRRSRAG
jgi:ribosomal RNA-processing protein 8